MNHHPLAPSGFHTASRSRNKFKVFPTKKPASMAGFLFGK